MKKVDQVFFLFKAGYQFFVAGSQVVERFLEHLVGLLGHALGFGTGLSESDRRRVQHAIVEVLKVEFHLLFPPADDEGCNLGEDSDQRQEDDGIDDVEQGVGIGDVPGDKGIVADGNAHLGCLFGCLDDMIGGAWGDGIDDTHEKRHQEDHVGDAEEVEHEMSKCRTPRSQVRSDSGDVGGDGGADVFSEHQRECPLEGKKAACGEGQGDTDSGAAALHDDGQDRPDGYTEQGVISHHGKNLLEFGARLYRIEGALHGAQAKEQQAEAEENLAAVVPFPVFGEEL